jgi:opacity protein-like surface antigen
LVRLPDSLDGFSLGGGGEVKLGGPWTLKGEYRWTHLDGGSGHASSKNFQSIPYSLEPFGGMTSAPLDFHDIKSQASANLDNVDIQTVRAVLTYHFWTGGGYGG